MKSKKDGSNKPTGPPVEPTLVLRRRSVASLSDDQLSEVAGGHPHPPTCEPTCPDTCAETCPETCGETCGYTCGHSNDIPCTYTCHEIECTNPFP